MAKDPINIKNEEIKIWERCAKIEGEMPKCFEPYYRYLKNKSPRTRLAYLRDLKYFFRYLIHQSVHGIKTMRDIDLITIDKISGNDINSYLDFCRSHKLSETEEEKVETKINDFPSLARKKASMFSFFKYLYRQNMKSELITDKIDPIKVKSMKNRIIKTLEEDQVMDLLAAVQTGEGLTKKERAFWESTKQRDYAILMLFLSCALRISELSQMNVSTVDFHKESIVIYRKGGKEKEMPLNLPTIQALDQYITQERARIKIENEDASNALFLSLQGSRLSERQIREMVKKYTAIAMRCSKKEGYSPHKLRATAATALINRGNDIYAVQEYLDHENVTTTQLYAKHKRETARQLNRDLTWDQKTDREE